MINFTTPCFIRKNTPELRKKLEELGYLLLNSNNTTLDAHNFDGRGNHKTIDEGNAIITSLGGYYGVIYEIDNVTKYGRIDCGDNEDLFLAIATLREDNDKNQWFVTERGDWKLSDVEHGFIDKYKVIYHFKTFKYHKASVEELIEHFKN